MDVTAKIKFVEFVFTSGQQSQIPNDKICITIGKLPFVTKAIVGEHDGHEALKVWLDEDERNDPDHPTMILLAVPVGTEVASPDTYKDPKLVHEDKPANARETYQRVSNTYYRDPNIVLPFAPVGDMVCKFAAMLLRLRSASDISEDTVRRSRSDNEADGMQVAEEWRTEVDFEVQRAYKRALMASLFENDNDFFNPMDKVKEAGQIEGEVNVRTDLFGMGYNQCKDDELTQTEVDSISFCRVDRAAFMINLHKELLALHVKYVELLERNIEDVKLRELTGQVDDDASVADALSVPMAAAMGPVLASWLIADNSYDYIQVSFKD